MKIVEIRERVIKVQPNQTVQEMKLLEIRGCHFMFKSVVVLFLEGINCSVRAFSRSSNL